MEINWDMRETHIMRLYYLLLMADAYYNSI